MDIIRDIKKAIKARVTSKEASKAIYNLVAPIHHRTLNLIPNRQASMKTLVLQDRLPKVEAFKGVLVNS